MYKIFVGDMHITGRRPEARLGNIIDDQFEKVEEIIDIANYYDADIVQLGDIVHTDIIAKSLESEFGRIINQLKNNFYFIWGNHDLLHHSKELKDRTSLGVLYANNHKLKHMSENPWGWDWRDWNSPIKGNFKKKILVTHKAIIKKSFGKGNYWWILNDRDFCDVIDDKKFSYLWKYDLIVCGHWHKQYQFKYKNTQVINPGVVVRQTVRETQMPEVIIFNVDKFTWKRYKLDSAKPTKEVISDQHLKVKGDLNTDSNTDQFADKLGEFDVDEETSFLEVLCNKAEEVDKPVKEFMDEVIVDLMEKGELLND